MSFRIAYFINQYPKVSHSFIRREILALERLGIAVQRIALRGWNAELVDSEHPQERVKSRFVLKYRLLTLLWGVLRMLLAAPLHFFSALAQATRMGWRVDFLLHCHKVYLAEAYRILPWPKSFGATHVHAQFGTNSAEIVMLAHALRGPPYSFTVHGPEEFDKPQSLAIAAKVRRATFVVATTSFAGSQFYRGVGHARWQKVEVVHCGLEPAFSEGSPMPPPTAPILVSVGRLSTEKGQLLMVEAAARLAEMGVRFDLVLVDVGEKCAEITALIANHRLGDRVHMTGSISTERLREEILRSRALVSASSAEGLPMVIMEAMALRRPILTTCIAGIPELIQPGINGWPFPAGSIDALTATMQNVPSCSPEELRVMGEAAYARVLERHSIDVEAGKLAVLFRGSGSC